MTDRDMERGSRCRSAPQNARQADSCGRTYFPRAQGAHHGPTARLPRVRTCSVGRAGRLAIAELAKDGRWRRQQPPRRPDDSRFPTSCGRPRTRRAGEGEGVRPAVRVARHVVRGLSRPTWRARASGCRSIRWTRRSGRRRRLAGPDGAEVPVRGAVRPEDMAKLQDVHGEGVQDGRDQLTKFYLRCCRSQKRGDT